jgi:hypothetical protein
MVKREFRIVALEAAPNESIILLVVPAFSIQQETKDAAHVPDPTKVIVGPAVQSEDARVLSEGVKAVFDEMRRQGLFPSPASAAPFQPSQPALSFLLSKEEYEELGKPTPNEIVTLTVERQAHE